MYPADFAYHEASSVEDALNLLRAHNDQETVLLAGGNSLVPAMKAGLATPDVVIDISGVDELDGVHLDGDTLVVGATTRFSEVLNAQGRARPTPPTPR